MSVSAKLARSFQIGGKSFAQATNFSAGTGLIKEISISAAQVGTLTTRTDNNTGVVTITGTNLISTGARVDIFWSGGSRRGMTVGTVSGQSVPIDLGAGDNLPSASTALQVSVATSYEMVFDGDDITAFGMWSQEEGQFTFCDASVVEIFSVQLEAGVAYVWDDNSSLTNPFGSGAVAAVYMTHLNTAAAKTMRCGFLLNI